jgi:hypothetical protein
LLSEAAAEGKAVYQGACLGGNGGWRLETCGVFQMRFYGKVERARLARHCIILDEIDNVFETKIDGRIRVGGDSQGGDHFMSKRPLGQAHIIAYIMDDAFLIAQPVYPTTVWRNAMDLSILNPDLPELQIDGGRKPEVKDLSFYKLGEALSLSYTKAWMRCVSLAYCG